MRACLRRLLINGRLKFLYRINSYLTPYLKQLLCNALIQPHFKSKLPTVQNRFIRYCLQLDNRSHIETKDFQKLFNQYLCSSTFKFLKEICLLYFHDIYRQCGQNRANTRSSVLKLRHILRNTCSGQ